ncbi:MAG: YiiX/YebB-like N1pC/P60 family cysteine hydrolase, partial [Rhodothermales bacterium]|nr:YiiX/YebB-like N1pC/P60 family cysteine hydrolase [Rhodothermales bacterium]
MKLASRALAVVVLAFAGLSVPGGAPDPGEPPTSGGTFVWDQDSLWLELESRYANVRGVDCGPLSDSIEARVRVLAERSTGLSSRTLAYDDPIFASLETELFSLAPSVAACPNHTASYIDAYQTLREAVKDQSTEWDMSDNGVRRRLYRSLYGGRAALEEVMLQHPDEVQTLVEGRDEPSATPSAEILGVRIHSGDILVSRGGYPTSALISRGSDYPGNFSHVAQVHVDEEMREISVVEAHIEIGVAVATAEQYLRDKKLRIMVLRPRADLPALVEDPMLPHRAATLALERALAGHIAYDFQMDYRDPSKLFCSEVASAAYREVGITLWMGRSTITSEGLRRWLAAFGVEHFETQEPSDLEY